MGTAGNWSTFSESRFPWERDALSFVRERFPSHEPYRAWSNFEFVADDGSLNEVDLLVFSPQGFFLIEIKSHPGRLTGDVGTWTWFSDGRASTIDNPLFLANLKAKKLRSLLERQKVFRKNGKLPFVEPLVFCSDPTVQVELEGNARFRVCTRDRETKDGQARPGIIAAICRRECPGLDGPPKGSHDTPTAKLVSRALEQAGIRESERQRRVGDFRLDQLIGEGPGYQDWQATHISLPDVRRRVRLYLVRDGGTPEERETIARAALREAQLLESLGHPGILRVLSYTEHEKGPALVLEHDPLSIRLDHFLAQHKDSLDVGTRLDLVRQIAEAVHFAHEKKVVHRALSAQSILVWDVNSSQPRIKIFNWQLGFRDGASSTGASRAVTATSHVDRLVEDSSTAYMAPEVNYDESLGEHFDVFSLGAIAYHVFSGLPPASNGLELSDRLRGTTGLQISAALNGAGEYLQELIRYATNPEVANRMGSAAEFLSHLDEVEDELTEPDDQYKGDPARAQAGAVFTDGFRVVRRLGQGGCAVAYLVERDGEDYVLKLANDADQNERLKGEASLLKKLHQHANVVAFRGEVEINGRVGFLAQPVYVDREKRTIETLGVRRRREGRLATEFLQRFGEDLLGAVVHLEEQGVPHRDIKPENIAVGMMGRSNKLHLVLFDFSLSKTPADNIRAGTKGYLDPFLPLRKPSRWDLHAERYAAAATLYELATGSLPTYGDGATEPSHLDCEATIDAELFDPDQRDTLTKFFTKAFRRNPSERFDNAEVMLREWRLAFEEKPPKEVEESDHADEVSLLRERLSNATFDTAIAELDLGTRATNALDRANVLTVEDLLTVPARRLLRLRGIGTKTRGEIATAVRLLREKLGRPTKDAASTVKDAEPEADVQDVSALSLDLVAQRLLKTGRRESETVSKTLRAVLGIETSVKERWPSQADVAQHIGVTRARIGQILGTSQTRWGRDAAVTAIRDEIARFVSAQGGVVTPAEVGEALLIARGSVLDEPERSRLAGAVVRAAVEVERTAAEPRFLVRREEDRVLLVTRPELATYALRLGALADELAEQDPLAPGPRAVERLRQVAAPEGVSLPDSRLVRLAAAVSKRASVSARGEFYPFGLPAERALKLSLGAISGVPKLTVAEIKDRIASRYPEAAPLPERPALTELLRKAGLDLVWDSDADRGRGAYLAPKRNTVLVTSGTESVERLPTASGGGEPGFITPEEADARQFEERLTRGAKDGAFLTLLVNPKHYQRAAHEIAERFPTRLVDLEGLFLDALQQVAEKAGVKWDLVIKADAVPGQGDWKKLMLLVDRALPIVEEQMSRSEKTLLVVYAGLLARYDRMALLNRLRERIGRPGGIAGLWILVPGDQQALLEGKAIPLIGPGERARIPRSWVENVHRSNGVGSHSGAKA